MKNPVRLLIAAVIIATIGLVIALLVSDNSSEPSEASATAVNSPASNFQQDPQTNKQKESAAPQNPKSDEPKKKFGEDDIAVPVDGNPLVVTLLYYPELGQISIEQYSSEGKPTGNPLKSGTQVQIPDPNIPGGKIIFSVP